MLQTEVREEQIILARRNESLIMNSEMYIENRHTEKRILIVDD